MIDSISALLRYLQADSTLVGLVSMSGIVAGIDPPLEYDPANGPIVLFSPRGGTPDFSDVVLYQSFQFQCIGLTDIVASSVYRALFDALTNPKGFRIAGAACEALGQLTAYPETEWPTMLTFFQIQFRNTQ